MAHPQYAFQHSVLLIDDPAKSENFIRTGLLSCPVHFEFCAGNLDAALRAVQKHTHDIVVVSMQFQDGLVLDFAQHLQKHHTNIPSIYMGESHLADLHAQVLALGALEVFQRPQEGAGLIQHVDGAIQSYRELQSRMRRSAPLAS